MEQSKEIALSKLGQQAYYDRASKGIRGQYEVERFQNILSMLEPDIFTRTTVDGLARLVLQRHRHHRERRTRRALRNKKALEDEVNRILIVLRASLNDDPAARDPHPWKYFNPKYYPSIPPVANPVHFRPSNQQHPPEDTRQDQHHFRRIAIEDTTESRAIDFMTGQSADIPEADRNNPHEQFRQTTALHEAVHASNYILVEYFVLTDFVVDALDENGETALDLPNRLENQQTGEQLSGLQH
ncbi:MAG: hypothetical protein LQ337_007651 [Flavoplaca oasis]|nr:MAG: hypothetical protein LQ337_007651 [Flavoplaca oasis]